MAKETESKSRNIRAIALIVVVILSMVFISGCASTSTPIKSQEDVSKSLDNVSTSVGKVSSILSDVDKSLGSSG